ncbi:fungal lipase-like domain-containing protein [Aspergillus fruticulosus]
MGFRGAWDAISRAMVKEIDQAVARYPGYQLVFTGHSLGGAIATMGPTILRKMKYWDDRAFELFTSGAPKIGNYCTAVHTTNLLDRHLYRATHLNDIGPQLPS